MLSWKKVEINASMSLLFAFITLWLNLKQTLWQKNKTRIKVHLRICHPILYNSYPMRKKWNSLKILNTTQHSTMKCHLFSGSCRHCSKCLWSRLCFDIDIERTLTIQNREVSGKKRKLANRSHIFPRKESKTIKNDGAKTINPTSRRDRRKRERHCVNIK